MNNQVTNQSRKDIEIALVKKMMEIQELYKQYNPEGNYLSCYITQDYISCNNSYFDEDAEHPVNVFYNRYLGIQHINRAETSEED